MLNTQQEQTLNSLQAWLSSDTKAINLSAKAGFGKTHLLCAFINLVLEQGIECTVIAPTHAALFQLASKLGPPTSLLRYKTVAKALCLYPIQTNTSTKVLFGSFGAKPISGLLIVDESSMLGVAEVKALIRCADKIIFSGDANQLAPVKKKSGKSELAQLDQLCLDQEMMRSTKLIAEVGYTALVTAQFVPESSEDGSIVCHENEKSLKEIFLQEVTKYAKGDCVFITRTNAEAQKLNGLANFKCTGQMALAVGSSVRLYSTSDLGVNNSVIEILSLVKCDGYYKANNSVKVALPLQYKVIKLKIEAIVEKFNNNLGTNDLNNELIALREIEPIDYPYCITVHKSQGSSIPVVFANSQRLSGRKSFYVAYTRAINQLHVTKRNNNTLGVRVEGGTWVNKNLNLVIQVDDVLNTTEVRNAISNISEIVPSISHLACVLNPSHASKSAKGWTLVV